MPDERKETAAAFLARAHAWYAAAGITIERVLSDNGACYRSRDWAAACAALGFTASVSAVTIGVPVLVLGVTDSTTITAAQVIVQPPSTGGTSPGGQVIPKTANLQGASDPAGQIPSDYTQGSGTLVSGTTADKAIEAALTAYPGGVIDRVVALGNGDYEVHTIGVSWPHHVFVNADFQVIGANS